MISKDIDIGKAKTMLHYLGRAKIKFDERAYARKKLELQLKQLKKINTKGIKTKIEQLEFDISEALEKEKKILQKQSKEDVFHVALRQKVMLLEKQLGKYLETRGAREQRVKELEVKIKKKMQTKKEQVSELKKDIKNMDVLYKKAIKSKKFTKTKLSSIKNKITSLKKRLKKV